MKATPETLDAMRALLAEMREARVSLEHEVETQRNPPSVAGWEDWCGVLGAVARVAGLEAELARIIAASEWKP